MPNRRRLPLKTGSSLSESAEISNSSTSLNTENETRARYSSDLSISSGNVLDNAKLLAELVCPLFVMFNGLFVSQERLIGCRVRDTTDETKPIIVFVKDAYMLKVADNEVDFYDALVETQTFQAYCEETYKAPA